jgi:hypothetical protein
VTHSSVKVMCIVGARPNFMKAAPVIEALERRKWATVTLVHTGQHYSREMSDLFFDATRGLPTPQVDLQVGSGPHGQQTGHIMSRLEPLLQQKWPDLVIVFGDVNSTVGAALCAAKMGIDSASQYRASCHDRARHEHAGGDQSRAYCGSRPRRLASAEHSATAARLVGRSCGRPYCSRIGATL